MRTGLRRGLATIGVAGVILAGCADGGGDNDTSPDGQTDDQTEDDGAAAPDDGAEAEQDLDDLLGEQDLEDPNDDVVDGEYRGAGIVLPVPEGWSLDPMAFSQGYVLALPEDGAEQLSARAINVEEAEAAGQSMDLDTLLDSVRDQVGEDAEVDEEVELEGAARAHQLTFLDLPAQQEGGQASSVTVVLAEDDQGHVGEFTYAAATEDYDDAQAALLVDEAGFDPDSDPPGMPQPQQPVPDDGGDLDEGADTDEGADSDESADTDGGAETDEGADTDG